MTGPNARLSLWIMAATVCLMVAAQARAAPTTKPAEASTSRAAAVIELRDEINDYSRSLLERRIRQAKQAGAKVILIDLDTYGGAVTSALEISHFIKQQDDLHIIAYVNSKAYSAGAMIAMACDEIIMAPVAALGDCAPIMYGPTGIETLGPHERAKAESPIVTDFRDSAMRNGYDPLLAEAMVVLDRAVYWVQKDDQKRFVSAKDFEQLTAQGWKPVEGVPNPVDGADTLLTVHTDLAVKLGLATGTAPSVAALAEQRLFNIVGRYESTAGEQIVRFLNSEVVRGLMLTIFLTTLYIAFKAPGHGFPEVAAMLLLGALLGVPLLTGYAQWWEIVAVLLGIGLLAVEIFILPGFGFIGFTGIILVLGGLVMTFVAPEPGNFSPSLPTLPLTWDGIQNGLLAVVVGLFASFLLSWWLKQYLPKLPLFNRLILTTTVGSESGMVGSLSNIDPMEQGPAVGASGTAATDLKPGGIAKFRDAAGGSHMVSVVSDSGFVAEGTTLVVREVHGSRVVVRPAESLA